MKCYAALFAAIGIAVFVNPSSAQDHGHLNVGSVGVNQGDPLIFDNGADFASSNNYVKTLTFATSGTYAGYYQANITLTALAATDANAGPVPNAPALGAYIFARLLSVEGPAGGAFAFWNTGATAPTFSLVSGATGTNEWLLSQNTNAPGSDPFGHIHGRRFTATVPGIYAVSFQAIDHSTNGASGGFIHASSEVLTVYFQAGDNVRSVQSTNDHMNVRFGARLGFTWQLQAATSIATGDWTNIGNPVSGNDYFREVTDTNSLSNPRFYRTVGTIEVP